MSGISILQVGEKKALFGSYRSSASLGRRGAFSEGIKESRDTSFPAL
jgi:hypothetical protein